MCPGPTCLVPSCPGPPCPGPPCPGQPCSRHPPPDPPPSGPPKISCFFPFPRPFFFRLSGPFVKPRRPKTINRKTHKKRPRPYTRPRPHPHPHTPHTNRPTHSTPHTNTPHTHTPTHHTHHTHTFFFGVFFYTSVAILAQVSSIIPYGDFAEALLVQSMCARSLDLCKHGRALLGSPSGCEIVLPQFDGAGGGQPWKTVFFGLFAVLLCVLLPPSAQCVLYVFVVSYLVRIEWVVVSVLNVAMLAALVCSGLRCDSRVISRLLSVL